MAQEAGWNPGEVARRLGVAASTLREWSRRYGIGHKSARDGNRRVYSAHDLVRLEERRRLMRGGRGGAGRGLVALPGGQSATARPGHPAARHAVPRPRRGGPPGGGLPLFVPGGSAEARRLARAAMALDDGSILEIIRVALACDATAITWEDLLVPVLSALGDHYQRTGSAIEAEHLLSACAVTALAEVWSGVFPRLGQPPVLLACAEEEQHTLPVHALAASLADEGIASYALGAGVPYHALASAMSRTRPGAVFVWSQTAATGDPALLAECAAGPCQVIIGGPGWRQDSVPPGIRRVAYLPEAVSAIAAAVAGGLAPVLRRPLVVRAERAAAHCLG
jgi:transposase-like protein